MPVPIGPLTAVRDDGVLVALPKRPTAPADPEPLGARDDAALADVRDQLTEYFAGERTAFDLAPRRPATRCSSRCGS